MAAVAKGVDTYVFKRGVVYRGELVARESGRPGDPIRLTSDPAWGEGEAVIVGSEHVTGWRRGAYPKHSLRPPALQCEWIGGIGQLACMATSLATGLVLSRRNARGLLLSSTVAVTAMGIVCLLLTSFAPQMACQVLLFVSLAVFFNSFQTFMEREMAPGGQALTVGRYALAWSAGSAAGFLSSGSLYRLGDLALCAMTLLVGTVVLTTLLRHPVRPHTMASADEHVEDGAPGTRAVNPRYVCGGLLPDLHGDVRAAAIAEPLAGGLRPHGHLAFSARPGDTAARHWWSCIWPARCCWVWPG
jgi:hypothetical protein